MKLPNFSRVLAGVTVFALFLAVTTTSFGLELNKKQKRAQKAAYRLQSTIITGEYDELFELSHPSVIEQAGGRENMERVLSNLKESMKKDKSSFEKLEIGDPSPIEKSAGKLYLTVPFVLTIKSPDSTVNQPGYIVGVSEDNGKNWLFVNGLRTREIIKTLLPDLPDALQIPHPLEP